MIKNNKNKKNIIIFFILFLFFIIILFLFLFFYICYLIRWHFQFVAAHDAIESLTRRQLLPFWIPRIALASRKNTAWALHRCNAWPSTRSFHHMSRQSTSIWLRWLHWQLACPPHWMKRDRETSSSRRMTDCGYLHHS